MMNINKLPKDFFEHLDNLNSSGYFKVDYKEVPSNFYRHKKTIREGVVRPIHEEIISCYKLKKHNISYNLKYIMSTVIDKKLFDVLYFIEDLGIKYNYNGKDPIDFYNNLSVNFMEIFIKDNLKDIVNSKDTGINKKVRKI